VFGVHAETILLSNPPLCQRVQHITLVLTLTLTLTLNLTLTLTLAITINLAQLSLDTLNQAINELPKN